MMKKRCWTATPRRKGFIRTPFGPYNNLPLCHAAKGQVILRGLTEIGVTRQTDKVEFGGESPLTSRDGPSL